MQISNKIWEDEPGVPETQKPVFMSMEMFEQLFKKDSPPSTPWIIAFVKKYRTQAYLHHSDWVANTFKILAEEMQGQVRFALVDVMAEEELKETFDVRTVPQTFFIKDGVVYETNALQIGYKPLREFILKDYLNPEKVFQTFGIPFTIGPVTLRLKYAWNWYFSKVYINQVYKGLRVYLKEQEIYDQYPQIDQFFKMLPNDQAKAFLVAVVAVVCKVLFLMWLVCAKCCSKKAERVAPAEKPANKME